MFKGHPKGLYALALANTGERFGYYTMLAVFALFLRANFGLDAGVAGAIYSTFLGLVYFMPLFGGIAADKFGFGKMVTIGITIMFVGYLLLSFPLGGDTVAMIAMLAALLFISVGTGLFKGNLQVMVGNLYDDPKYADKRDSGFSIFYMAINIGALFAPTAAVKIKEWAETSLGFSGNDAYHFSFAVACASLIASIAIYYIFRSTFRHVEGGKGKKGEAAQVEDNLTPAETKARMTALFLVFAVVIFFWMAFHQNGLTLTYFADEFTEKTSEGLQSMAFNVWNLVAIIIAVYAGFSIFQSESAKGKITSTVIVALVVAYLAYQYANISGTVAVSAPIFQHFNPFYVVALTPVSMAIFGALAKRGKEPSAPRKIAYGMLVAAAGFAVMAFGSMGLLTPDAQAAAGEAGRFVSANWLISTYLVLTFAELLLSPMGISFVSKVAPPKYKGMMMGCWFVATALGNMLVAVGGFLWGGLNLTVVWSVFIALCLISALFMFVMMKRLESATK
ncbi:MAG: peptide MFS transporter [Rikenellaceae bacterium]|nr:peptide MFS transporter [Rikenellaceae bacterium]